MVKKLFFVNLHYLNFIYSNRWTSELRDYYETIKFDGLWVCTMIFQIINFCLNNYQMID